MLIELLLFLLFVLAIWWLCRRFLGSGQPKSLPVGSKPADHRQASNRTLLNSSSDDRPQDGTDHTESDSKAMSFEPDGSFKLGDHASSESVQAYAARIQRNPGGASSSPAIDGAKAVAAPEGREAADEWRHIASTDVVSDEEREFVASLLRQIDENNRDISSLSARVRETDRLREQLNELQTRLDQRELTLVQLTGLPYGVESAGREKTAIEGKVEPGTSQLKSQVQTLSQQLLVRDRELSQLKSSLAALQGEVRDANQQVAESKVASQAASDLELRRVRSELQALQQVQRAAELQLHERNQRVVELEAHLESVVAEDDQNEKSTPARTFASGAVANAAARAASKSTDPKPQTGRMRQLYQPPEECDDLKLIKGIGFKMEQMLNQLGVTTFRQLASFEQKDIEEVSAELKAFPGRIQRDNWVGQAAKLQQQYYDDNVSA